MKTILVTIAIGVGILAILELGLLVLPWTGPTYERLTFQEKNQRLWGFIVPELADTTEAAKSKDTKREVLINKIGELEARIARLEKQVAAQNSMLTRLKSAPSYSSSYDSFELQQLKSRINDLESQQQMDRFDRMYSTPGGR